jgi:hypothetical protein
MHVRVLLLALLTVAVGACATPGDGTGQTAAAPATTAAKATAAPKRRRSSHHPGSCRRPGAGRLPPCR